MTSVACCVVLVLLQKKNDTIESSSVLFCVVFGCFSGINTAIAPHHMLNNGGRRSQEVARLEGKEMRHRHSATAGKQGMCPKLWQMLKIALITQ